ncbi:ABC transporter substrate-binding protein [Paenibacillus sp. 481]|uniref:ABC transporter substrate-binding protein n=1 Tax=Paenibacillus sp. 481 TaxID=2835869 RepID=UPI001E5D887B|nr:extracellular solute-binding protein [Paenibacillus sp. 481]UHA74934.1 extracellular solute-binding protein [Paenibacillus sp. 481]
MSRAYLARLSSIFVMFIFLILPIVGCRTEHIATAPQDKVEPSAEQLPQRLTVWSYDGNYKSHAKQFEKLYPDVEVEVKEFTFDNHVEAYLQAMEDGSPPDIMEIENKNLGEFNAIEGIVNLLDPPFDAGRLKMDIAPTLWEMAKSFDKKALIALPITFSPKVTFYRKDIIEKYGFPSEPEELAAYMKESKNWLKMARELKKDGIFIAQWDSEALELSESTMALFDESLMFNRNSLLIKQGLSLAREVNQRGLGANTSIWNETGQKMLRSGNLAMVYMGAWGEYRLHDWAPNTAGLWRATSLPFGLYGFSDASSLMMSEHAKNKPLAWEFMKMVHQNGSTDSVVTAHLPSRRDLLEKKHTSTFLGGQLVNPLYMELADRMIVSRPTPLDLAVMGGYRSYINQYIYSHVSPDKVLSQIERKINQEMELERSILLDYLHASKLMYK